MFLTINGKISLISVLIRKNTVSESSKLVAYYIDACFSLIQTHVRIECINNDWPVMSSYEIFC